MNLNTSKKFQNLNLNLNLFIRRPHIAIKNDNAINNSKKCSVKFECVIIHAQQRKTIKMITPKKIKGQQIRRQLRFMSQYTPI
mmetsp:Transcript_3683/g.6829  ORF Transcript_3683/g.6829 Transcript_3683/m.6829 type:complete len:83 (+) Transcript_3683:287-535(+)